MPATQTSYSSIKEKLLESGELFEDEDFPANLESIEYKHEEGMPDFSKVEWKRPSVS